ncbi:MAG: tRNA pseudouridine(55) synthase TruB [Actinomycetota bacterium]
MNGFVVVDKPAGITSHGVVARARKLLNEKKIGHAGTLDPDATGILVLGVGRATRLLQFMESEDKAYVATFRLGIETSTQDASGEWIKERDASHITQDDVQNALKHLEGEIEQIPPMVSAIKIGGEPLYKKARRGEEVTRTARRVQIHELELTAFDPPTLRVRCSKGTYVRTLVHDLGQLLDVGAHVVTLRRTGSGTFTERDAISLDQLAPDKLRPMEEAIGSYPKREVTNEEAVMLAQGKRIPGVGLNETHAIFSDNKLIAMAIEDGTVTKTFCVLVDAAEVLG